MKNRELLETLLATSSPSGFEIDSQLKLIKELEEIDDAVIKQNNGNVIHILNPNSKVKLLFTAHIDEVALVVKKINDNGTCTLVAIGNALPYMYAGQHVKILADNQEVSGVIGYLPSMEKGIEVQDLILDIGATSKEDAERLVSVGNAVVVDSTYKYLANDRLSGRALDNKLSVYILAELLKRVKGKTDLGIYFSSTVGEETTGRGAVSAVNFVKPNCAIVIDVNYATDIKYRENLIGDVNLGKGVNLIQGSLMNKVLTNRFINIAKDNKIPYQITASPSKTFTDIDYMYSYNGDTPCYLIGIPLRYMHSSVEVCDLKDVDAILDLLEKFILEYDKNMSFSPF